MEQETGGPAAPRRSARILGRRGIEVLQQLHDGVTGQALDVEWVEGGIEPKRISGGYGDITRDPEFKRMGENSVGVIQRKVKNRE